MSENLSDEPEGLTYSNISYGKALIRSSKFQLSTRFEPQGDQATAIEQLVRGIEERVNHQVQELLSQQCG